jgi:hypothetical protein
LPIWRGTESSNPLPSSGESGAQFASSDKAERDLGQSDVDFRAERASRVVTNEILPSDAVFVPASALFERFPDASRSKAFEWMVQAIRAEPIWFRHRAA